MGFPKNHLAVKPGFAQIGDEQNQKGRRKKQAKIPQLSLIEYKYKGINFVFLLAFESKESLIQHSK